MKYLVTLARQVQEIAEIEVEAESEDDAILAAKDQATNNQFVFSEVTDEPYFFGITEAASTL